MGILSSAIQVVDGPRYGAGRFRYVGDLRRPVLILHTIEGALSYRVAQKHQNPPHLWYSPSRRELYQTVDLRGPAFALRHPSGTPETNNRGPCLQVELEGSASQTRTWPEAYYENIAQDVVRPLDRFCRENYGVTLVGGPSTRTLRYADESDGLGILASTRSALRLSDREWLDAHGLVGHQHVPDNTHWDPGGFRMTSLLSYLTDVDQPRVLQLFSGNQRLLRGSDVREWQELLVAFGFLDRGDVDGLFGARTDTATRELQRILGVPVDGIVTVRIAARAAEELARRSSPGAALDLTEDALAAPGNDQAPVLPVPAAPAPTPLPTATPVPVPVVATPVATREPEITPAPTRTVPEGEASDQPWLDLTDEETDAPFAGATPTAEPRRPERGSEANPPVVEVEPDDTSSLVGRLMQAIMRFLRSLFR